MSIDPYVYPGTDTLRNNFGVRDNRELAEIEAEIGSLDLTRIMESGVSGRYDLAHLQEFHRQIFARIYPWAGEVRTVDIAKTGLFAHPPHIKPYLSEQFAKLEQENHLQRLPREQFVDRLAHYLGEVNAVHPFREGNGRAQRAFFSQLAKDARYFIAWDRMDPERNVEASIASHNGDNRQLRQLGVAVVAGKFPADMRPDRFLTW